ncbi:MAG TPA: TatD family hydrolase [Candidatus Obscuribacterales bacterium]
MGITRHQHDGLTIIDSHAHVVAEYYAHEREEVIQRAFDSGVAQIVNPGVVIETIPELIELSERYGNLYIGVGLHPHDAKNWTDESLNKLKEAAENTKVVAIGECGLDFYYQNSDPSGQMAVFREHIKLALDTDKPIIVHCRDAWQEAITLLKEEGRGELRGVFHCFTGDSSVLPEIEELGFYVSFSGIVTFPNAKSLQAAAPLVKNDRLLVETDCPYLAPQKVRGKRNEPSYVWYVAEKLAELRSTTLQEIATVTTNNARTLFRLPALP